MSKIDIKNSFPQIGDEFPELEVETTHGKLKLPKEFKKKWFLLFSHLADFTPVCTTEYIAFAKRFNQFQELKCELIGLSIDQIYSHMKWVESMKENFNIKIQFPIISDNGEIAKKLGIIHTSNGNNTIRAVFLVDPNGIIRLILYYPQELGRNIDEILRIIEAIQISDNEKVIIPANWPNNDLIENQVIIPPAKDEITAKERSETYECYNWLFCYKSLEEEEQ